MVYKLLQRWDNTLQWRNNERDGVSNHQRLDCLLNRLFRCKSKKTSKIRVTGLCVGNSPAIGEFPAYRASNAENVSIWWRHHEKQTDESTPPQQPAAYVSLLNPEWDHFLCWVDFAVCSEFFITNIAR